MVNPINQNALLDLAMKAWDATKQPLKQRGPFPAESLGELPENPLLAVGMGLTSIPRLVNAVAPVGIYEDGSYGPAWPGVMAVPAEGMANFGRYGYDSPEAVEDNARSAFDVAGGAMTGSLATGLAGGMVDNAVGSAATKAAHDVSKLPASAAFKFNGEVFPGRYHAHGISAAAGRFGNKPVVDAWNPQTGYGDAEGFLTMDGAFVSRKDATDAIRASGLLGPYDYVPDELHAASLNDLRDRGLWANAKPGAAVPLAVNAVERSADDMAKGARPEPSALIPKTGAMGADGAPQGVSSGSIAETAPTNIGDYIAEVNRLVDDGGEGPFFGPRYPGATDADIEAAYIKAFRSELDDRKGRFDDWEYDEGGNRIGSPYYDGATLFGDAAAASYTPYVAAGLEGATKTAGRELPMYQASSGSAYGTLKTPAGNRYKVRVADHARTSSQFDQPDFNIAPGAWTVDDFLRVLPTIYANAPTGAALPLAMEGQDQDPALIQFLRSRGQF